MTQTTAESLTPPLFPATHLPHEAGIWDGGEHGEVFTRRWGIEMVLDLAGYRGEIRRVEEAVALVTDLQRWVSRAARSRPVRRSGSDR